MRASVRERLYARVVPDPETGCLLWTGRCSPKGYGYMRANGRSDLVHRVAWELENGPIPAGLEIDHVRDRGCRYRHCVNLAHLELVTHAENCRRGDVGKHLIGGERGMHCKRGHPFDEVNTYRHPDGKRRGCRICREIYRITYRQALAKA